VKQVTHAAVASHTPLGHVEPSGKLAVPHCPLSHVAASHGFEGTGHSLGLVQTPPLLDVVVLLLELVEVELELELVEVELLLELVLVPPVPELLDVVPPVPPPPFPRPLELMKHPLGPDASIAPSTAASAVAPKTPLPFVCAAIRSPRPRSDTPLPSVADLPRKGKDEG
jgi:hypothetical protein